MVVVIVQHRLVAHLLGAVVLTVLVHRAAAGRGHLLGDEPALALNDVKLNCLALNQEAEAIADNVRLVHKHCEKAGN